MTNELVVKRSEETMLDCVMSKSTSIVDIRGDRDWQQAFEYALKVSNPVTRETVEYDNPIEEVDAVIAVSEGCNDGPEWIGIFLMKDGRFLFLKAGCDYSGWDCQANGQAEWSYDLKTLWSCIAVDEDRERLLKDFDPGSLLET